MDDARRYCLLAEPLITIRNTAGERRGATLPEVLFGLVADEIVSFEALQPHQQQPWYCFLVQLAALGLGRAGRTEMPSDPETWRELLLGLTDGQAEPWCLVVTDLSKPAFMQSPVPEETLEKAKYKCDIRTPDELDMLVTAKNHDIKRHRIARPTTEHWLYSLVTLQTLEGFLGRGNYGIVRMNGGFGSRPMVGMAPALDWGPRFRRDVAVLLSARARLVEHYHYDDDGHALLWLLPWDGAKSSSVLLASCDPLFVEICRRVRFLEAEAGLRCWRANTKAARIAAPDSLRGVTGDPWTPVQKAESKALTLSGRGFSYDLIRQILLSGEYVEPVALQRSGEERDGGFMIATALVRGQGQTEGLHHRVVPLPAKIARLFNTPTERQRLAERAAERVETASTVQSHILYPALLAMLKAGSEERSASPSQNRKLGEKARPWTNAFDSTVDEVFFADLWASIDLPREEGRRQWQERLFTFAQQQLEAAIRSVPVPSLRRYRAISQAESILHGAARKQLKDLFPETGKEEDRE